LSFTTMRYQDQVMREVDARVGPDETVLDGVAYALRRRSAYKYWFMPSAVRLMAQAGRIEPYDLPQLLAAPPAAVIHTVRIHNWFVTYPRLAMYVVRHYVPLYRNLWLPGLTAAVGPQERRAVWVVPKSGRYVVHASALLARHPWIANPINYGFIDGTELEIPLTRLPALPEGSLQWRINGMAARGKTLVLKRGDRVELDYLGSEPAGVLVVPEGIDTLCSAPETRLVF
jgi:hypothetical protein